MEIIMAHHQIAVLIGSLFDAEGDIGSDGKALLKDWMDQYLAWIKTRARDASLSLGTKASGVHPKTSE
jgi:hypothetical protein